MRFFLATLTVLHFACAPSAITLTDLKSAFARPEYTASYDGWAEARRRRLLGKYLHAQGVRFSETAAPFRGKYNRVVLRTGSQGAKAKGVTLSLTAEAAVGNAQARCDKLLFALLEKKITNLDFIVTDSCIGLTAHEDEEN